MKVGQNATESENIFRELGYTAKETRQIPPRMIFHPQLDPPADLLTSKATITTFQFSRV